MCASTNACEIKLQFIQQEHRIEVVWNVRELCPWVLYEYMCLPLYQWQEIYCWRYLWATNSLCTGPWIDTAAVQSRELQALLGDKASWSASEILLLYLKIPPFSTVCLCLFSVCFVLWLCMSFTLNSLWRKQYINSNLSNQYEFMQKLHTSRCVYLSNVPTELLSYFWFLLRERLFICMIVCSSSVFLNQENGILLRCCEFLGSSQRGLRR